MARLVEGVFVCVCACGVREGGYREKVERQGERGKTLYREVLGVIVYIGGKNMVVCVIVK